MSHALLLNDVPQPRQAGWGRWLRAGALVAALGGLSLLPGPLPALERTRLLQVAAQKSPRAVASVQALLKVLDTAQGQPVLEQLRLVNEFFNREIRYASDEEVWGVKDYWATPVEMMDKGRGDCEDYAIAKYFALRALGIPAQKLTLRYVFARGYSPPEHVVLAFQNSPTDEPWILDSLPGRLRAQRASERTDLSPIPGQVQYFNELEVVAEQESPSLKQLRSYAPSDLDKWKQVLPKIRDEGFR